MLEDPVVEIHEDEAAVDSARTKLRAFEDDVFGKDAPRINGGVERGIGSPFSKMTEHQKAHHAALEQLVAAEQAVADACAGLATAQSAHEASLKSAQQAEQAAAAAE